MTTEIYNFGKAPHPLDIPGELLAEACELGRVKMWQPPHRGWIALIATAQRSECDDEYIAHTAEANTPAEALQAAIAKARKHLEKVK